MTESEKFLERWSRRKRFVHDPAAPDEVEAPLQLEDERQARAPQESAAMPQNQSFDLASLPSIESIDAKTDVTAFLRPGVPPDLTRAALRRAWSSDPAIRDFIGPVENGWDFNDPQAIGGFGPISAGDVAKLVSQAIGELSATTEALAKMPTEAMPSEELAQPESVAQANWSVSGTDKTAAEADDIAPQKDSAT